MARSYGKKLFGVALDPSDDPMSLELKQAWMSTQAGIIDENVVDLDPYDAFTHGLKDLLDECGIKPAGKYFLPSWLCPRPRLEDKPLVNTQSFGEFYDCGGVYQIIDRLQEFVQNEIFPAVPIMVGVDHSATKGVISALGNKYGPQNLSVIVLDQHFDAIPQSIRREELADSGIDKKVMGLADVLSSIPEYKDSCCCGNFWHFLIDEKKVIPANLSFIGVADYPRYSSDRGSGYQQAYLEFEKKGCRFFKKEQFRDQYLDSLSSFIAGGVNTPYVYVSLDLDVGSYNSVWAARYMDSPGLSVGNILHTAYLIKQACKSQKARLTGFDIMEFNMHFLGIDAGSGFRDNTLGLAGDFIKSLLGC